MKTKSVNPTETPSRANDYVNYLINCRTENLFLKIKQITYDLLNIKEGDHLIDIGCGIGDDVREMAQYVGKSGKVIGLCNDEYFITEAKKRSQSLGEKVEFLLCDAHSLPYPDNSFDGCRAERVLEHLSNPQIALDEMIRIAKPGARIVVAEPDLDTYTLNSTCPLSIRRKIVHAHTDSVRNGTIGRQLYQLLQSAKLKEVAIIPQVITITDYALLKKSYFEFEKELDLFVENKIITDADKNTWLNSLDEMQEKGQFFASGILFIAVGKK